MKFISLLTVVLCSALGWAQNATDPTAAGRQPFHYQVLLRSFLLDDQRIQWSGLENSFAAEAVLSLNYRRELNGVTLLAGSQIMISQPFSRNILSDEYRQRYRQNFDIEPFSFKELFIGFQSRSFILRLGKFQSPFGQSEVPSFCNAYSDQPFIRVESIMRWDTGLSLELRPGILRMNLALVNGSEDQDTNSAKSLVARLGLEGKNWALGISGKYFGDRGSETQKLYRDHVGIDMKLLLGALSISAELIHEQYGLHRPLSEEEITWPRSYYYRDINFDTKTPIKGTGGYLNLKWTARGFVLNLNYGEYIPEKIGQPLHDEVNRRLLASLSLSLFDGLEGFVSLLIENDRPREPVFSGASPYMYILGMQYVIADGK